MASGSAPESDRTQRPHVATDVDDDHIEAMLRAAYEHVRSRLSRVEAEVAVLEARRTALLDRARGLELALGRQRAVEAELLETATAPDGFWQEPSLEELALQQGISQPQTLDALIGGGASLWQSTAELEAFVAAIRERRREPSPARRDSV